MLKNEYYVYIQYLGPWKYIGKGKNKRYLEIKEHINNNKKYSRVYKKYGLNNIEIINWFNIEEDAYDYEMILISLGKKLKWKLLNCTKGGSGGPNRLGKSLSTIHKQKIGLSNSKIQQGKSKPWLKNRKYSNQQIETYRSCHINQAIKIICIETNEIFNSAREAARKYNLAAPSASGTIIKSLDKENRTAYGFHWKRIN